MIYVFEGENNLASIVFDGKYLSEETKVKAIQLESLPIDESTDSQNAILKADNKTGRVWFDYEDIIPTDEEKQQDRLTELEGSVMELTMALATLMGGTN